MHEGSERWREVSRSEFVHERAGLEHARALLPDHAPYRAWSNFEFRDTSGKWHEVDLLVLGQGRLHLVELKHYSGVITGSAYRWQRHGRSEDSPLLLTRRKAQRLRSVIGDALREIQPDVPRHEVPYIQECVFLHHPDGRCQLPPSDKTDLFGLDGRQNRSGLPSLAERLLEPPDPNRQLPALVHQDDLLSMLLDRIGFAARREQEVGSWRIIDHPTAEGEGWQDWPAEHRLTRRPARIRFSVVAQGVPEAEQRTSQQLVQREYELTSRLKHERVLAPEDIVESELGVGLVYERNEKAQPLDLWLADKGATLSLRQQLDLVRQLAEALAYVHQRHVVHRGLSPRAALVTESAVDGPQVQLGGWQVAGAQGDDATRGTATRLLRAMEAGGALDQSQRQSEAYLAPEGRWSVTAGDRVRLDVFGLGALTYLILTGRPPAATAVELRDRLQRDNGLDLSADLTGVTSRLRSLVLRATAPKVSDRLEDVGRFLALLDDAAKFLTASSAPEDDCLNALPGEVIGDQFELERRLGSGSTAAGLLVRDLTANREQRVLKVALNEPAAARLEAEGEVLRSVARLKSPRLVRLLDDQPLRIGQRTALLLELAGEETLSDELRKRPRLSLDLLERWGTDLLEALVALDAGGLDHRDVKPSNLGIRAQRSDRAKHLVLFDFSLARTGAGEVTAGTPPYLDPFLGSTLRPTWDSAAERYAGAVTLFEMATGHAPSFGDGVSDPAALKGVEATVEPTEFDPSVAPALVGFFRTALQRESRQRFATAAEMLDAWRKVFSQAVTTVPADASERAEQATSSTPLVQAGLSARAISALEPLGVHTVADLAAVDPGRLSQLRGLASATKVEIQQRAKQWRAQFGVTSTAAASRTVSGDELADPTAIAQELVTLAGSARAVGRRRAAAVVLGVPHEGAGDLGDAFASLADIAPTMNLAGAPQVFNTLAAAQSDWGKSPRAVQLLNGILARVQESLAALGGVAEVGVLVRHIATGAGTTREGTRTLAGLVRLALDRADQVERGDGDPSPVLRRRGRKPVPTLLLATYPALLDSAAALGARVDELVAELAESSESLLPPARAAEAIGTVWPEGVAPLNAIQLVRTAARLSARGAATRRGELHARDLAPRDAVRIALGAVAADQEVKPTEIVERVRARFPDLALLPTAQADLDGIVRASGLDLQWDVTKSAYASPPAPRLAPGFTTRLTTWVGHLPTAPANREKGRLEESIATRSFLAVAAHYRHLDDAQRFLTDRFDAQVVDLTGRLIEVLQAKASAAGVPWDRVQLADAAPAGSRDAAGLKGLLKQAVPEVEAAVTAEIATAGPPLLLVEAEPLAAYGYPEVLARWADLTFRRGRAVWLLVPRAALEDVSLDGRPLPLAHSGQVVQVEESMMSVASEQGASLPAGGSAS